MQRILTLIIAAGVIYMLFQQNISSMNLSQPPFEENRKNENQSVKQEEKEKEAAPSGNFLEKTLSNVLLNVLKTDDGRLFLESLLQPESKNMGNQEGVFEFNSANFINSLFKISTFGEGAKGPASCGHIVTVEYKILTPANYVVEENTITLPLGSENAVPGLDVVVVGMKTGQTRHATISSKYFSETAHNSSSIFKLNVLLKEIMPNNFADDSVKIFDDKISYNKPLLCGNTVIFDARITQLKDGKVIYDSVALNKKINMKLGNINYPMIFSHSLHNKIPVGTRTVIAKGGLFKSYMSIHSAIFPDKILPENEYFMIEFFNFDNSVVVPILTDQVDVLT